MTLAAVAVTESQNHRYEEKDIPLVDDEVDEGSCALLGSGGFPTSTYRT